MKNIFLALLTVLFPLCNAWGEVDIDSSRIDAVVLYRNGATITREAVAHVEKGSNVIILSGITPHMVDESLQVAVLGNAPVRIQEVKVEKTWLREMTQERIDTLRNRFERKNVEIKEIVSSIQGTNSAIDFLKKMVPVAENRGVSQTDIEAYATFLENSLSAHFRKVALLEDIVKKLNDEKTALEKEIKKAGEEQKESKSLVVTVFSESKKEIPLQVSYVVRNAEWSPLYDARIDSGKGKVEINAFALIKQSTGEDWTDAAIEISTTKPTRGPLPELTPWYLNVHEPAVYRKAARAVRQELMAAGSSPLSDADESPQTPKIKTESTSFSFVLPARVTIPSDKQPHRIVTANSLTEAKLDYWAVPKLSRYAYLKAGEKRELKTTFSITFPRGTNVRGLE